MAKLVETVGEVFTGRLFNIPNYQRGYAWGNKQVDDLIQDVEFLAARREHFLGTLVIREIESELSTVDEEGKSYIHFDVIDGQQRLTSLVLFLHAIYMQYQIVDKESKLANGIYEQYLAIKDIHTAQKLTKLTLNRDCQDYFRDQILDGIPSVEGPTVQSHLLLQNASDQFSEYLSTKQIEHGANFGQWIKDLFFKLTQHLTLMVYEVESDMEAGVLFETMNDRGKALTEFEKTKNYLLYIASKLDIAAPNDLCNKINSVWSEVFENLMASGLGSSEHEDRLLRAQWLMAYEPDRRKWEQSRSIKTRFSLRTFHGRHVELANELRKYLALLSRAVIAYCDIHKPGSGSFNSVKDHALRNRILAASTKLVRLAAQSANAAPLIRAQYLPLLMGVRLNAQDGGKSYLQIVEMCEKFDFRIYGWLEYRTTTARSVFYRLGYDYFHSHNFHNVVNELTHLNNYHCSDSKFLERFDRQSINWYGWSRLHYFLYEYECFLAETQNKPLTTSWEQVWNLKQKTIEHILPQSPQDPYWLEHFTPEQRERWVHDIGNLSLTYDNSSLSNKSFLQKKGDPQTLNSYAASSLYMERLLVKYAKWTEHEILHRREVIKEWALKRWRIEPLQQSPVSVAVREGKTNLSSAEQRLIRIAENHECAFEFKELIAELRKCPIYLRMQINWQGVMCTPFENKSKCLIWLGPDLYFSFEMHNFSRFFNVSSENVVSILNPGNAYMPEGSVTRMRDLKPEDVPKLRGRIQELSALLIKQGSKKL